MSTRPRRWQAAANHNVALKPILSMTSESNTMLMAKGHRPTPASSPICVWLRSNSLPHAPIENARRMKQNDVATSAAKHTAKVFLASADTGAAPALMAASVLIVSTPSKDYLVSLSQILVHALFALPDASTASMNAITRAPVAASGANNEAAFGERDSRRALTRSAKSL